MDLNNGREFLVFTLESSYSDFQFVHRGHTGEGVIITVPADNLVCRRLQVQRTDKKCLEATQNSQGHTLQARRTSFLNNAHSRKVGGKHCKRMASTYVWENFKVGVWLDPIIIKGATISKAKSQK